MEHVLDAVAAAEIDAESLGIDLGSPLLRERRTTRDRDGVVFEFADDRYRPDVVAFSIVNARTIDARS
jgi:GntR family transcriptional regulator